jgi:DNA-binding CsgD family transcriptional regulator
MHNKELSEIFRQVIGEESPAEPGGINPGLRIQFFERILYGIDAIMFLHDVKRNRKIWTNGGYKKVLGYSDDDFMRLSPQEIYSLVHPDDQKVIIASRDYFNISCNESFSTFYRVMHFNGHWVWMYYHFTTIQCDGLGYPNHILGVGIDFSQHIKSENHLKELIAENHRSIYHIRLKCLTSREKEIISYLAEGYSCKEISRMLEISYYTAETHIRNIHHKLGVKNLASLLQFAIKTGLSG